MADSDWFHELIRGGYHRVVLAVLPATQQLTAARTVATDAFAQGWMLRQFLIDDPRREQWLIRTALAATARDSAHPDPAAQPAHPPAPPVEAVILHEVLGFSIAGVAGLAGVTVEEVRSRLGGGWIQLAMDLGGDVRVELGIAGLKDELRQQVALPTREELLRAVQAGAAHRGVA